MPTFRWDSPLPDTDELNERMGRFPYKLSWFLANGYRPHTYQFLFHTDASKQRHLLAGRRGGKTLGAAWETAAYALNPAFFAKEIRGSDVVDDLWFQFLAKNHKVGRPGLLTFLKVLKQTGLTPGKDFKFNKTELIFEFDNALVEFKTADDPESLRGAGLDMLWVDEAATINNRDAWDVISPSLVDKDGLSVFTTTPKGRNWYYEEFYDGEALQDDSIFRVEYRSVDNPHLKAEVIEYYRKRYHPLKFKQEFEASFDAMAGRDLSGDWLHYYDDNDRPKVGNMKIYMGVDPAPGSTSRGDKFAISVIGVAQDTGLVYLLEQYAKTIPFPEQVELLALYHNKYRPEIIGIESVAYQAVLAQQVARLTTMPPVVPMFAKGKKSERILAMSPLFKIGKVLIRATERDFINEWINYDSSMTNPSDDCLDSMEIALRCAGALLPIVVQDDVFDKKGQSLQDMADAWVANFNKPDKFDPDMGAWY